MLLTISYSESVSPITPSRKQQQIFTAEKEIAILFPYYYNTNRTNKHTHIHKSSFNNNDGLAIESMILTAL